MIDSEKRAQKTRALVRVFIVVSQIGARAPGMVVSTSP
jgi:hypothetical protein